MESSSDYDFFDIEKQQLQYTNREQEGQDTITSLSNQPFLKQISRLKSVNNSKTSINSGSNSNKLPNEIQASNSPDKPRKLFSIFKVPSKSSLANQSITELLLEDQRKKLNDSSLELCNG